MSNAAVSIISAINKIPDLEAQIASLTAENERLREAIAIAATWTAEPGVTIAEIRAALQPKEGE